MAVSGFFGKRNLEGIELEIIFPAEVYAKSPFILRIVAKNRKKFLTSFLLRLHVEDKELLIPYIESGETRFFAIPWVFKKRGVYSFSKIYISSIFPFSFFTRYRKIDNGSHIIVFPELKKGSIGLYTVNSNSFQNYNGRLTLGIQTEIISLRDYTYGDSPRLIHWKASAKTESLKIKELGSMGFEPLVIDFHKIPIDDLEEKIKLVTYAIVEARYNQRPIGLKINGRFFEPTLKKVRIFEMLKELALYENV
ncbi:MAG: DUF58 domain-containing protein [Deltaproteobacteria bacterium]|nr:DUF58 domain-containing protein [Deltaproteobacteria bacterium]